MPKSAILISFVFAIFTIPDAYSHSGGLNAQGCHNNRKTGGYHCHRSPAPAISAGPAVKMSRSKICHAKGTTYYTRTFDYTSFDSLDDCLAAGGRLPKNE